MFLEAGEALWSCCSHFSCIRSCWATFSLLAWPMLPWGRDDMGKVSLRLFFSCSLKYYMYSWSFYSNKILKSLYSTPGFLQKCSCPRMIVNISVGVWWTKISYSAFLLMSLLNYCLFTHLLYAFRIIFRFFFFKFSSLLVFTQMRRSMMLCMIPVQVYFPFALFV